MSALDAHLPFLSGEMDEYAFEAFCRDLLARTPTFERVRRWGVRGNAQQGIDILAERFGAQWAFQCKYVKEFGPEKARTMLAAATHPADRYVLLLARAATRDTRAVVEDTGWELWDADDLSQRARQLPLGDAVPLVRAHFGAPTVRSFLGVDHDTPWSTLDDHFEPLLRPGRLFTHAWPFAGRDRELADLVAFAQGDAWVAVLPGRGGVGKSRLVLEAGRRLEAQGVAVRVLDEGRVVLPEHVDRLPDGPALIVVDDAHRRDDLPALVHLAHRARAAGRPVKVLLSTRPHAVGTLRSSLARAGVDAPDIHVAEPLGDLDDDGRRALARAALGDRGTDDRLVARLVRTVGDSPLVMTVGGSLIGQGRVDFSELSSDSAFRTTVLDRFQDEALGRVPDTVAAADALAVLQVAAAAGPLRMDAPDALDAAAGVARLDAVAFRQTLAALEAAGVLLRRGQRVRISPDLLADHILAGAALLPDGTSTGYAERVYDALAGYAASDVLRNLAELDWRQRRDGAERSLLSSLWTRIEKAFLAGTPDDRLRILRLVTEAAYYLPHQTMRLCRAAVDTPPAPVPSAEIPAYHVTQDDVLYALPDVLRRVGYSLDVLPAALDVLWELAQGEGDLLRPYPEEARKIIEGISEPSLNKPVDVQRVFLDCADRWLDSQAPQLAGWNGPPEPLPDATVARVVAPVLRWKGDASWSEGGSFFVSYVVPRAELPHVRHVRRRAISLVEASGVRGGLAGAAAAVDALASRVSGPSNYEAPADARTLAAFRSEARWSLVAIARILKSCPHPVLADLVWRRLQWVADRTLDGPQRRGVRCLRHRAASVPDWPLLRALHRPHDRWTGGPVGANADLDNLEDDDGMMGGWETFVRSEAVLRTEAARSFLDADLALDVAVEQIATLFDTTGAVETWLARSDAFETPQSWMFLSELGRLDPVYGRSLATAFSTRGDRFAAAVAALVAGAREGDGDDESLQHLASGTPSQRLAAIRAVHSRFWQDGATPGDWTMLRLLVSDPDLEVRVAAARAWRGGLRTQPSLARPLLSLIMPDRSVAVADELLSGARMDLDALTPAETTHLLNAVSDLPTLESHDVLSFLKEHARRDARAVFRLLMQRLSRTEDVGRAVPDVYRGSIFEDVPDAARAELLAESIQVAAEAEIAYDALRLAEALAHGHPPAVREVVLHALRQDDAVARVALHLVTTMPEHLPLSDVAYVRDLLGAAEHGGGPARAATVARRVRAAATSGSRSRSFGEPSTLDVEIRDAARRIQAEVAGDPGLATLYGQIADDATASIVSDLASDEDWEDAS